jgi:hypothetical protein
MARPRKSRRQNLTAADARPDDLYDYARPPARRPGRPAPEDPTTWTVKDDWPEDVPVTEAEIEVFEAWFGDLFDEFFSTPYGQKIKTVEKAGSYPSWRSLAACRPLRFLGRSMAPIADRRAQGVAYGVGTYPGLHHRDGGPGAAASE